MGLRGVSEMFDRSYIYVRIFAEFFTLPWQARAAWTALCYYASWNGSVGECWPSQSGLAKVLGLSTDTVARGLRELKRLGFVKCVNKVGGTCRYSLWPGGAPQTAEGDAAASGTNYNNNNKNNIGGETLTPERFEALFDGLWAQYRRFNSDGRAEAKTELARVFPAGLPMDEVNVRQGKLVEMLNEQGETWEENLQSGARKFNPRMGRWLRRQFSEAAS